MREDRKRRKHWPFPPFGRVEKGEDGKEGGLLLSTYANQLPSGQIWAEI